MYYNRNMQVVGGVLPLGAMCDRSLLDSTVAYRGSARQPDGRLMFFEPWRRPPIDNPSLGMKACSLYTYPIPRE